MTTASAQLLQMVHVTWPATAAMDNDQLTTFLDNAANKPTFESICAHQSMLNYVLNGKTRLSVQRGEIDHLRPVIAAMKLQVRPNEYGSFFVSLN